MVTTEVECPLRKLYRRREEFVKEAENVLLQTNTPLEMLNISPDYKTGFINGWVEGRIQSELDKEK